jgi:hypothetical protein
MTNEEKEELLKTFYRERLLPLAAAAREKGIDFFPLAGDESAESYYIDRDDSGNYVHEINSVDLAGELEKLWSDFPELAALAALAEPLVELAEAIKEDEESTEEISPFIYAMF